MALGTYNWDDEEEELSPEYCVAELRTVHCRKLDMVSRYDFQTSCLDEVYLFEPINIPNTGMKHQTSISFTLFLQKYNQFWNNYLFLWVRIICRPNTKHDQMFLRSFIQVHFDSGQQHVKRLFFLLIQFTSDPRQT